MTSKLITEQRGPVGFLVLNAPQRRNALSLDMWQGIPELIKKFEHDAAIRCIVITGAGTEAFAAGADISEFEANRASAETAKLYDDATRAAASSIIHCSKPVVAAIRGICFGGGVAIAIACDLRIASPDARFCIPAARLGIAYGFEGTAALVDRLGASMATEMLVTARVYSAAEALTHGLIHQIAPAEDYESFVTRYTSTIAANAPLSMASSKLTIQAILQADAASRTAAGESMSACMTSEDYREGRNAFLEKRPPHFHGR